LRERVGVRGHPHPASPVQGEERKQIFTLIKILGRLFIKEREKK
jgi:hypothetical protein